MPSVLYINPSRVAALPIRKVKTASDKQAARANRRSVAQVQASAKNLINTAGTGKISQQTKSKISSCVQWLCYLAELKDVVDPETKRVHQYRVGLVTLSLPTGCEGVEPKYFTNVLLRQFIDTLNYQFKLKNYLWKVELQKRGAPHVHITLDQYIPHKWLRFAWCRLLKKHGLMANYTEKFSQMSLRDYIAYRVDSDLPEYVQKFPSKLAQIKAYSKAYNFGVSSGWELPNCTDVHSVKNIKNLAGYMVKYMCKDAGFGPGYKGRVWGASYSLSRLRSVKCEIPGGQIGKFYSDLCRIAVDTYEKVIYNRRTDTVFEALSMWYLPRSVKGIECVPWLKRMFDLVKSAYHSSALSPRPHVDWNYNLIPHFVTP